MANLKPLMAGNIGEIVTTPIANLLQKLRSRTDGLTADEASAALSTFGPNLATDFKRRSLWLQFLARFRNPLVILLLIASALSAATGDLASFVIIVTMVLLSVTLDFVQEVRAENTVDALRQSVAVNANVMRNGTVSTVPFALIVPGDVVRLSPGDLVPADGRLLEANDLFVNQAMLTGESFPVEKAVSDLSGWDGELPMATNTAFMGSSVISGSASLLVVTTGKTTQLGQMAKALVSTPAPPASKKAWSSSACSFCA